MTEAQLRRYVERYLDRWFTTRAHLRRLLVRRADKLSEEGTERAEVLDRIDALLDRLERQGLLDDARFARDRARALHARGSSSRAIRAKLRQKGVRAAAIDAALRAIPGSDLVAACTFVRKRRIGPYREAPAQHRERDLGRLARAGFSYGVAIRVLDLSGPEAVEAVELGLA